MKQWTCRRDWNHCEKPDNDDDKKSISSFFRCCHCAIFERAFQQSLSERFGRFNPVAININIQIKYNSCATHATVSTSPLFFLLLFILHTLSHNLYLLCTEFISSSVVFSSLATVSVNQNHEQKKWTELSLTEETIRDRTRDWFQSGPHWASVLCEESSAKGKCPFRAPDKHAIISHTHTNEIHNVIYA